MLDLAIILDYEQPTELSDDDSDEDTLIAEQSANSEPEIKSVEITNNEGQEDASLKEKCMLDVAILRW